MATVERTMWLPLLIGRMCKTQEEAEEEADRGEMLLAGDWEGVCQRVDLQLEMEKDP